MLSRREWVLQRFSLPAFMRSVQIQTMSILKVNSDDLKARGPLPCPYVAIADFL